MKKDWYKRMIRIAIRAFITGFVSYGAIVLHYLWLGLFPIDQWENTLKDQHRFIALLGSVFIVDIGIFLLLGLVDIINRFQHRALCHLLPYHPPIRGE